MTEHNYKAGTIKSLKLINFMCHESFELSLGPRVNFIIGPNGSGKSALLTALVVVLGGRATTTSRARKTNDFVMYGKNYARITCVIHNYAKVMEKDQAFKPDEYGKEIIIEKTIYKEDTSKLALKNDKGKKVSERKQELDEMLEHFGILINNPICILNQEISKTFLHSKKPEDKYELFMKATNLEQIEQDYEDARQVHKSWQECNDRKSIGFRMLNSEYQSCKEKTSFLMNRVKLQETYVKLGRELVWAIANDHEEKSKQITKKIEELKNAINMNEAEIKKREDKIKNSELNIEQQGIKIQSCKEECQQSQKKYEDLRNKEFKLKSNRIDVKNKIDLEKRTIQRLKKDQESLEKSIADARRQFAEQNSLNQDTERRKLEIEQLERELPSDQARERSIRQHTHQLSQSMTETRTELHKANMKVSEISNELSAQSALLRRLKGGQENELKKYGDAMVKICEEVEKAHQQGRFRVRPLGPVGYYIKLRSQDVAAALELHLGRNAHAFTCDNVQDMQTLNGIIKKVKNSMCDINFREPLIITRKFAQRHDTSRFKANHDEYKTMLDYVDVDENAIYNVLVDRTSLESVLFIPDYSEAESLMITPSMIPRGTRCAYTKDCFVMYPRTANGGYRSIANQSKNFCLFSKGNTARIRETEQAIEIIKSNLRDAENNAKRLQDSLNAQRSEYDSNNREIRKILDGLRKKEEQLLNLKTTLSAAQPEELSAFETELNNCIQKIAQATINIERETETLATIESDLRDTSSEKESAMEVCKQREQCLQTVEKMAASERSLIKTHQSEISQKKVVIAKLNRDVEEEAKNLDKVQVELDRLKQQLPDLDRPNHIRPTEQLREERKKIERQLNAEIEENADPDELMETLNRRMREIEGLIELKNHNQLNFDMSTKTLKDREDGYRILRTNTVGSVSMTFSSVMRAMGMNGLLTINLQDNIVNGEVISKAKTLEMSIDTTPSQRPSGLSMADNNSIESSSRRRSSRSQPNMSVDGPRSKRARLDALAHEKENMNTRMTDTRSLSGGERSFSTVAFVLALWHHCSSPFKLMDEIDVFMDMVTRRLSYNALIKFAHITDNPGQFIFFSPLELPKIEDSDNLVRVFEMPRIIRKGAQSQIASSSVPASEQV